MNDSEERIKRMLTNIGLWAKQAKGDRSKLADCLGYIENLTHNIREEMKKQ